MSTEQNPSIPHTEAAQARVQELRVMRDAIPYFVIPEDKGATRRLNSAASVPPAFIEKTVVAVTNNASLVRGDGATPAEIRELMSYADAYGPVADELEALAQFVRHSVAAARHKAGSEALTTYSLARRLAKLRQTAGLAPYVADMRRALGNRGLRPGVIARRAAKAKAQAKPPIPDVA